MRKWLKRIAIGIAVLALLVLGAGATYEQFARARAKADFPPPGKLVNIGGRKIQIDCRGSGTPTVVFESGLDGLGSLSWSAVRDKVAGMTRACAYSRAGIMWSDKSDRPFSGKNVADDLHRALMAAGERPPYIMVGHSLGGPYLLIFTHNYPRDVAGLVFVDASHPDQIARLTAAVGKDLNADGELRLGAALAWTSAVRIITAGNRTTPPNAPPGIDAPNRAYLPTSLAELLAENNALAATLADAGRGRQLARRPIVVLTHGAVFPRNVLKAQGLDEAAGARMDRAWLVLQNDEATWSSRSRHEIVAGASHYIQFDRPQAVVDAVRDVVEDVRADRR